MGWSALPSPVQGYHGRDHDLFTRYHAESKTPEGYRAWLEKWVLGIWDWSGRVEARAGVRLARILDEVTYALR